MWERLSERARMALDLAEEIAREGGEALVVPEHLLAALLRMPDCGALIVFRRYGVNVDAFTAELGELWRFEAARRDSVARDPSLQRVLSLAYVEANRLRSERIGTEHLLLAMTCSARHPVALRLARLGLTPEAIEQAIRDAAPSDAPQALAAGMLALLHRRGTLDALALMALADLPAASLGPEGRSLVAALRAELEFALLNQPIPIASTFSLGEAVAAAVGIAAERRETFRSGHLVAAIADVEGTRLREVAQSRGLGRDALLRALL